MREQSLATHESLEIHELIAIKTVSLTKALTMQILVSDEELKEILRQEVTTSKKHIEELQQILKNINY